MSSTSRACPPTPACPPSPPPCSRPRTRRPRSDDPEPEPAARRGLGLPSAQDELISAVAAANPHTVVVIDAGAPVTMPWLGQVAAVVDAWYPGESNGAALASVLYGATDPSGHLPVTFPRSLSQVPAATPAQFPRGGGPVPDPQ